MPNRICLLLFKTYTDRAMELQMQGSTIKLVSTEQACREGGAASTLHYSGSKRPMTWALLHTVRVN